MRKTSVLLNFIELGNNYSKFGKHSAILKILNDFLHKVHELLGPNLNIDTGSLNLHILSMECRDPIYQPIRKFHVQHYIIF